MIIRQPFLLFLFFVLAVSAPTALAETLNSSNYNVENPTFDIGGEPGESTNYQSRESIGDQNSSELSSSNFKSLLGFLWPVYPGVPGQPSLTNTGGELYNSLDFVVTPGNGQQTDTVYAIAISSDDFATTYYIQTDDTLGTTPAYQSYVNWGGGSGERVVGLSPNTTYKIKVKASYGSGSNPADTETAYSSTASASTSSPNLTVTFSLVASGTTIAGETTDLTTTANTIVYGSLVVNSPKRAGHKTTISTNAVGGYTTTLQQDGNLRTTAGSEISAITAPNSAPATWPAGITQGYFGYQSSDGTLCTGTTSRFATNNRFAGVTTTPEEVSCSTGPVASEETSILYKVEIGSLQPAGSYQNRLTYITTAQF